MKEVVRLVPVLFRPFLLNFFNFDTLKSPRRFASEQSSYQGVQTCGAPKGCTLLAKQSTVVSSDLYRATFVCTLNELGLSSSPFGVTGLHSLRFATPHSDPRVKNEMCGVENVASNLLNRRQSKRAAHEPEGAKRNGVYLTSTNPL